MSTAFLEIEYTTHNGSTFHEMGTHVIAKIDRRFTVWNQSDQLIQNARFIASTGDYASIKLIGIRYSGRSDQVRPLPDGRKNVPIAAMSKDERASYLAAGGYHHP